MFASEIKSLWAAGVNKTPDMETLFYYMQMGRVHHPYDRNRTFFKNIIRLKPGHYFTVDLKTGKPSDEKCYWSLPKSRKYPERKYDTELVKAEFLNLFKQSVKRRLRSDVPVGSSLSGGLDSSAVVCVINELNANQHIKQNTFSARFPGFIKDEGKYMQLVLDRVNAQPYFTYPDHNGFISSFEKLCYYQDEPFGSASIYAQYEVMKLAKEAGVTVLLDGQGADEMLAGYEFYRNTYKRSLVKSTNSPKFYDGGLKALLINVFPSVYGIYKKNKLEKILEQRYKEVGYHSDFIHQILTYPYPEEVHIDLYDHLRHDLIMGNLEDLLRYADRNSMAHSREVRLPFLNHELVEFVLELPDSYKIHNEWTKWIQRIALEPSLPPEITWRKDKIGYEPPQKDWMSDPNFQEIIQQGKSILHQNGILSKTAADNPSKAANANELGDNSWYFLMTAQLFK